MSMCRYITDTSGPMTGLSKIVSSEAAGDILSVSPAGYDAVVSGATASVADVARTMAVLK